MKFVTITVNGQTKTMVETSDGVWEVTNTSPSIPGVYPVELTLTTDSGNQITVTSDDPYLAKSLLLIVSGGNTVSGQRMLDYYPNIIKVITEFQALMWTEGFEFDQLNSEFDVKYNDAYLYTMGEDRISEWEKALKITPLSTDTLEQRRDNIIAKFRGGNKLNTKAIADIVQAYTNGSATSHFENGVLTVEVKPPKGNKDFKFYAIENELKKRVPAHIELNVIRDYSTWNDVMTNFRSWETVAALEDWTSLKAYIAPS